MCVCVGGGGGGGRISHINKGGFFMPMYLMIILISTSISLG